MSTITQDKFSQIRFRPTMQGVGIANKNVHFTLAIKVNDKSRNPQDHTLELFVEVSDTDPEVGSARDSKPMERIGFEECLPISGIPDGAINVHSFVNPGNASIFHAVACGIAALIIESSELTLKLSPGERAVWFELRMGSKFITQATSSLQRLEGLVVKAEATATA